MRRRTWVLALATLFLLTAVACEEDEEPEPAIAVDLTAFDFRYDTTTIPVELGAVVEVNFTNSGAVAHSFTVPDLDVELEVEGGDSASVNFAVPEDPGSFEFFCKFHPEDMRGNITVGGEGVEPGVEDDPGDVNDPDEEVEDDEDAEVDVDVDTEEETTP